MQYIPAGDISFYSHVCVTRLGVPVPELIKPRFQERCRIQDLDLLPLPHRIVFEIAGDEDGSRRVSDLEKREVVRIWKLHSHHRRIYLEPFLLYCSFKTGFG